MLCRAREMQYRFHVKTLAGKIMTRSVIFYRLVR